MLVGMNPGPWGMAQTGVPFGEVGSVRDFLHMPADITIEKPVCENAARPVTGLLCGRSEVSGQRLWNEWARARYTTADNFFSQFFVHNYCPLLFLETSGRNRTPGQLPARERQQLHERCDEGLRGVVRALRPAAVCGVGLYARARCEAALQPEVAAGLLLETVLHPSPASPAANRGWADAAAAKMALVLEAAEQTSVDWDSVSGRP